MKKRLSYCTLALLPGVLLIVVSVWLNVATPARANGGTRHVAPTGNDSSNDCTTPGSPCATIQHAVDVAVQGDTIKVAAGVYTDTHTVPGVGYVVVVELTKTVTLRGGYDASFSDPSDPEVNETVLDAERAGRVLYISGAGPTIENFTITGGHGPYSGGGIYVTGASPTISGNLIVDNIADGDGGAIFVNRGSAQILNNSIISNTATWAGGLRIINDADVVITGNEIVSNVAQISGGGIDLGCCGGVTPLIERNLIAHNDGGSRGGGLRVAHTHAEVVNNLFVHNEATKGAGTYLEGTLSHPVSTTWLHNTLVGSPGEGEALWVAEYVSATLVNNIASSFLTGITNTVPASSTVEANYTLFHNNGTDYGSGVSNNNEVSGDPDFVAPGEGDYHLRPSSAAIDAGVDAGVPVDMEGEPRPMGPAPDVGADEARLRIHVPLVLKRY